MPEPQQFTLAGSPVPPAAADPATRLRHAEALLRRWLQTPIRQGQDPAQEVRDGTLAYLAVSAAACSGRGSQPSADVGLERFSSQAEASTPR
jgi:hypothetical protein